MLHGLGESGQLALESLAGFDRNLQLLRSIRSERTIWTPSAGANSASMSISVFMSSRYKTSVEL